MRSLGFLGFEVTRENKYRLLFLKCVARLVLSREWVMETIIGDYKGATIGIHPPIPY